MPSEADLIETAADFARRTIAPNTAAWHATNQPLPRQVVDEYAALGLAALQVTRPNGGQAASYATKLRVAEAIAAHCFPTAFALNNLQGSVTRMEREGSPGQIARYLPALVAGTLVAAPALSEPGAGSDFAAIATTATKTPTGWQLDGEKAWVTNGTIADQLILYAQTQPGSGAKGIASFIVDLHAPGITRRPPDHLEGAAPIGTASIRLTAVQIPDEDLFAAPGQAFKRGLQGITGARIHVAAMIAATATAALRIATTHATTRHSFGKPLLAHQGLRWQLADAATALEAARLLVDRAATLFGAGQDAQVEAAMAKKFAVEAANRTIPACMQAMGAEGLSAAHPFARHLLAARVAAYVDGTTEMMNDRIGAALPTRYGTP